MAVDIGKRELIAGLGGAAIGDTFPLSEESHHDLKSWMRIQDFK